MAKVRAPLYSFNRGEVSKEALARVDVERLRLSAETQVNFMPAVLGPMMLRPGLQYIGNTRADGACRLIPFVFSNSDLALLELTASSMRVWNIAGDSETLVTRPDVATTVPNGDFSSGSGWSLTTSGVGAAATVSGGMLSLASPVAGGYARAERSVTVAGGDIDVEHAFRIEVTNGPVLFRAGTTSGGQELIAEATLETGTHSLAFIPPGSTVYVQLETRTAPQKIVDSIAIEATGTLELPTSWTGNDLSYVRHAQSGDVIFVACRGQQQRRIERRGTKSWSVVLYKTDDGPFGVQNTTDLTLTPGALTGNTTLAASRSLFLPAHVGTLVRLFSAGQTTQDSLAAANTFGATIRVTGVGEARRFAYTITGTWSGTLTLQRSLDSATSGFVDITTFSGNAGTTYLDGLDNSIAWYRIGFKSGQYTSGTATIALSYVGGGAAGIGRISSVASDVSAVVEVLTPFSSLGATADWALGDWSDRAGWPSSVAFHDGRLWWAGRDRIWGSISDAYASFDIDAEGDAGPINRSVGFGPVDVINWLLPLTRLIVGREGAETSIRSSSFDEPLTPTNFTLKDCSTQGSAPIPAVKIDTRGVFVQQSNRRVYELAFAAELADYAAHDLTRLNPDIGAPGFSDLAVQRQPDTQLHFVRADGVVAALVHDVADEVEAWWCIESPGGFIESVAVLPGAQEDRVYFCVRRVIGGVTRRFIERLARRDQCTGLPQARHADAHMMYSGAETTSIGGLSHLEGQDVVVWGWNTLSPFTAALPDGTEQIVGRDLGLFTVAGGQISGLPAAVTDACVGLRYGAQFKSAKLAYGAQLGTALTQKKKIDQIGLILANTHHQGLDYGQSFTAMDALPLTEEGQSSDGNLVWPAFDGPMIALPGEWDTDARLCLRASAPRPTTVLAAVVGTTTNE